MIGKLIGVAVAGTIVAPVYLMQRYFRNPLEVAERIGHEAIEYFDTHAEEILGNLTPEEA